MRVPHLAVAAALALALAGCESGQGTEIVMPDVLGQRLDVALDDIERAGIDDDAEVLGGGLLGIVDESNWVVCDQLPAAGQVATGAPRLTVDRSCNEGAPDPSGDSSEEPEVEPEPEAEAEPEPEPEASGSASNIDSEAIEEAFKESLNNNSIDTIESMCDDAYTHWACFYDGVEDAPGYLQVNLTTDGGWPEAALSDMADDAGRHWFNFIGCDFPDLSIIVVTINGLDHNVFRRDTQADSLCS